MSEHNSAIKHTHCEPIKSLAELADFIDDPPKWINSICDLVPRGLDVLKYNTGNCHYDPTEFIYDNRHNKNYIPKTLVCHDFKNGYLQDKFINGCANEECGYVFDKWSNIDIFVYFSHHLITIPPLGWINLAHQRGVKILGTFITEWVDGAAFWDAVIDEKVSPNLIEENILKLANNLAHVMYILKLDGWLINIENPISKPEYLLSFVNHLTDIAHKKRPGSLIIWYDSVTKSGELKWQNELNSNNRCFFDACDGIFLNYNWTAAGLRRSAAAAQHRHLDVYAGVDVFGRGCYGNGSFHSYLAARETREANVSMAIFAPGWTHETLPLIQESNHQEIAVERFLHRDNAFWRSLGPFLYTHPIHQPFFTTFNTGVNVKRFDLRTQDILLHRIPHSKLPAQEEELNVETLLRWSCDCLQLHHDHASGRAVVELMGGKGRVHRILACDIPMSTTVTPLTLVTVCERVPGDDNALLRVLLTVEDERSGCRRQYLCTENSYILEESDGRALRHDRTVKEVLGDKHDNIIGKIMDVWPDLAPYRFSAYNLELDYGKIVDISMEIVNGSKLLLRAFGIIENDKFKINLNES